MMLEQQQQQVEYEQEPGPGSPAALVDGTDQFVGLHPSLDEDDLEEPQQLLGGDAPNLPVCTDAFEG